MRSLTEIFGGQIVVSGEYPGWAYREDSKLRDTAVEPTGNYTMKNLLSKLFTQV